MTAYGLHTVKLIWKKSTAISVTSADINLQVVLNGTEEIAEVRRNHFFDILNQKSIHRWVPRGNVVARNVLYVMTLSVPRYDPKAELTCFIHDRKQEGLSCTESVGVMNSKQENIENVEGSGTLTHTEVQHQRSDHLSRFSSLNCNAVLKRTLAETDRKECTGVQL